MAQDPRNIFPEWKGDTEGGGRIFGLINFRLQGILGTHFVSSSLSGCVSYGK
jgi:hypothetical protein